MRETGDTASMGGGRTQGVGNFLQDSGAGNSTVWIGYVVPFGGNGEEVRRDTHRVTATDHREAIDTVKRQDMGDSGGAEGVREAAVTQSARTYIERRQENVACWVVLRPLFEVCAR